MANVKITDLTALSASDVASVDVLPIVDINADQTKKITISDLTAATAAANDFITFTQLNANINVLDANADAIEVRRVANVNVMNTEDTALQTRLTTNVTAFTAEDVRLNANINVVQDNVAAVEARRVANVTVMTDEDTALQARLTTNVTTFTNEDTALQSRLTTNVTSFTNEDTALQARLTTNVTALTSEDTALQARINANSLSAASNDFITFTRLNANINLVQDNVASATVGTASDTETRLNANLNVVSDNAAGVETRRVANIAGAISTVLTGDLTASRAMVTNGSGKIAISDVTATELGHLDGVTGAIQTQIDSKIATTDSASNDFVTFTRLDANINTVSSNAAAVETRRAANIAGAVSTITTSDLTASRAMVTNGSGKVAVSDVTATELGHLDGVSGAIQTQLDGKAALAGATFTGQVNMSDDLVVTGNLTVNGDTTTVSTTNLDVEDRMIMLADGVTGSPSGDVGMLFNRGNQGNAAFFYDESATTFKLSDTKDPKSNTALSPVSAANLIVGMANATTLNATTITQNGATLDNLIGSNVDGAISTVNDTDLTASRALVSSGSGKIAVSAVTSTELGHLDGVTGAIQTQIDGKQATITGAATTIDDADLTASRALVSSGSGKVAVSDVTSTELGHLDGVTSAIQTQIDAVESRRNANTVTATISDDLTITGNATIGKGFGVGGNTLPATDTISLGTPANVVIRSVGGKGGNVIIGDATATSSHLLDVRGTANTGDLTATSITSTVATGTAPFTVSSTTKVTNLNADKLDGINSSAFLRSNQDDIANGNITFSDDVKAKFGDDGDLEIYHDGSDSYITDGGTGNLKIGGSQVDILGTSETMAKFIDDGAVELYHNNSKKFETTSTGATVTGELKTTTLEIGGTDVTATATELNHVDGVTSAIQTQLDAKQATITGAATTIDDADLTASRALVSDSSGKVAVSAVTSTELGHLDGVTSAIQTQFTGAETRRTNNIAGAISTVTTSDLTASRALVSGSGGKIEVSAITSTEIGHLDGIDQNINSNLAALAAGIAGASVASFPTGDYGLLDNANTATDSFGQTTGSLTSFDMLTTPSGSLATEDLGALT